jgi:ATP-binding cassette, subfamily B, multidrug efflux pump
VLRSIRHMLWYARPYRRLYIAGTVALVFVDLLDTFTPKLTEWTIEHLTSVSSGEAPTDPLIDLLPAAWFAEGAYLQGLWVYAVLLVLVVGLTGVLRYPMMMYYVRATMKLSHDFRGRLFNRLQHLDARWHDRAKVGESMSLATNDMESVRMFYGIGLLIIVDTALYFLMVPLYMASIHWKLLLACLIPLPFIPLIVAKLTHTVERRYEAVQAQFATVSERARESFAGAQVVKSFAKEETEARSFAKQCREYFGRYMKFARVFAVEHPSLLLMLGLADLVVIVYGGSLVISEEISKGEFVAFFMYLIRLSGPMIGLGWTLMLYQRGHASMRRIERVLNEQPGIVDPENPAPVTDLEGRVEFKGLTFRFADEGEPVLRSVDVEIVAGKTLGIVGQVGCGKTALLNLIPRLYDPPPGTVVLDGFDVRTIPLDILRTRIAAVSQETFLFSETIRENIALGINDEDAPPDLVEQCARIAQVEQDILAFPKGYDTLLGERGVNLSGGQKQRVAIARALARRPAILLLDDCLSAVDTETEAAILRGLHEASAKCTAIIASHRISAVKSADEIIILKHGQITERGTHDELVALGGYYAELDEKQRLEAELEEGTE